MKDKLRFLKVSEIIMEDRYREDLGNIDELVESIKEKGILQPITVGADMHLLAGGRRFTAAQKIGLKEVPALIREVEGEIDAREIELIENVHRKDFTWQEHMKLIARIHDLKKEKDPNWSGQQTANLLNTNRMSVSQARRLASAIEVMPEIAECKTADDAFKVLKKAEENAIVSELVRRQKEKVAGTEDDLGHARTPLEKGVAYALKIADANYIVGDVFQHMSGLKTNGYIGLIECDPPYGVGLPDLTAHAEQGIETKLRDQSYEEVPDKDYPIFLKKLSEETYRIAGKDCWMIFWFAFKWFTEVKGALEGAGWQVDDVPGIWGKKVGRTPRPDILLARSYENFFICRKGKPTIIKQGQTNLWMCGAEEKKYHPAQRPVKLMEDIISIFLDGMPYVFVPFAGSGATLRACYNLGFKVAGVDKNPEYKNPFLLAVEADAKKLLANKE